MATENVYQTDAFQSNSFQIETQEEPPVPPVITPTSLDLGMEMKIE
jgi:hypothetical protein